MLVNKSNNGKKQLNPKNNKVDSQTKRSQVVLKSETKKPSDFNDGRPEELSEKKSSNRENSVFKRLRIEIITLIGSAVMLPILAVGTATYYFGSQAIEQQSVSARRANNIGIVRTELVRQQNLLTALLIGTGTTALVAGAIAALGTKKLIDGARISTSDSTQVDKPVLNLNLNWQNILKAVVEEARNDLNCDRVVVYSLEDKYGTIIAESVVAGYTQAIGKKIEDPLEREYLDWYGNSRAKVIDSTEGSYLNADDREELKQLEVKAILVTPIFNRERLLGLLVAHQCDAPRKWQQLEIDLLHRAAQKAGLTIENAQLSDRFTRLQSSTEESKYTHYDDAVRHIRQSLEQEDILNISVEEVHRFLQCDRVVVYSLEPDCGVVIAESVSAGCSRVLNTTVKNLDLYRDGIRAIDNIYEAQLSQGYIEQLETLEVKASLITPISNQGDFVLVAHQCSQPRDWQDYEIRWMEQIATQVGFALENGILLKKIQHERRPMQLLNDFSLKISQTANNELLNTAVEQVRKIIQLDRAVIYQLDLDRAMVVAESVLSDYPQASLVNDLELSEEYRENSPMVKTIADIHKSSLSDRYLKQLESLGVKATITAPIWQDEQLFGLLIGHQCQQPRSWSQQDTNLFTQLALQIGLVLDRLRLEELALRRNSYENRDDTELNNLAQRPTTVVQTTDIEQLDRLEPDLYQMLGTLHDLRNSDRPASLSKLTQLPIKDITAEAEEITDSVNDPKSASITGELVKKSPSTSEVAMDLRSPEDISELSARISQQSLFVTESFQKLAELAKQLSEKDKK